MNLAGSASFKELGNAVDYSPKVLNVAATIQSGKISFKYEYKLPSTISVTMLFNIDEILPENDLLDYSLSVGIKYEYLLRNNNNNFKLRPEITTEMAFQVALVALACIIGRQTGGIALPAITPIIASAGVLAAG